VCVCELTCVCVRVDVCVRCESEMHMDSAILGEGRRKGARMHVCARLCLCVRRGSSSPLPRPCERARVLSPCSTLNFHLGRAFLGEWACRTVRVAVRTVTMLATRRV
jgi:hypothetical protein